MPSIDCQICFCEIDGKKHSCADPDCSAKCCSDCLEALIKFSYNEEVLPSCPSADCNSYFILSSGINNLSNSVLKMYEETCLNYFLKDRGTIVQKRLEEQKMLELLREERTNFINSTFPSAVALVSQLAFGSKIQRLEKQKTKLINKKLSSANRRCMNSICNGFLDKNLICMTCNSEFCLYCEVKMLAGHICKQADLDSVSLVNNMVKCPSCKLPVFKNEGCDSITCSNCNAKFLYSTGKIGGHGSHNAKIVVDVREKKKLSYIFKDELPDNILEILLKLEAVEPKTVSKDTLLTPLKNYFTTGDKQSAGKDIAKKLDKYTKNKFLNTLYTKSMVKIEETLRQKDYDDDLMLYTLDEFI